MLHFQTVFWVQLLIISLFYTHKVITSMPIAEELSIECTIQCGVEADKCQKAQYKKCLNVSNTVLDHHLLKITIITNRINNQLIYR
ncbi:hypothetical protein Smp_194280.1 [Schistosoma mansoni]|uniref:hypothetical protein n=1 Tax=Schistosoma mansoni TaxID=6183 RepID=UPI00022C829E|nr:hypothetical protein Smp_194280.1 [Schistosoma mansoni]|eukprot:XP_018647403.1 hypothetical protein Smp_194280.1 [Schistosoma mansoni]